MPNNRRKLKKEMGIETNQPYVMPTFTGTMEHTKDEALMLFSYSYQNKQKIRPFYGVGVVYRVVKGNKNDLVYINFGLFPHNKPRLVVVYDNHSRRQLLTLKRGQVCQVYGICRYFVENVEVNGVKAKGVKLGLFAKGIQGWYVPTMLDIKKLPINEDIAEPSEKEQKYMEEHDFDEILDSFLNE